MKLNAGDRPNESELIAKAIAEFPSEFGLRSAPGKRFSISPSASYVSQWEPLIIQLYVYVLSDKPAPERNWSAWCKGTVEELQREFVLLPDRTRAPNARQGE